VTRKNRLNHDFSEYHYRLETARKKAIGAPAKPAAVPKGPGAPKGMSGAVKSQNDLAWMRQHDSPAAHSSEAPGVHAYTGSSYHNVNGFLRGSFDNAEGRHLANNMAQEMFGRQLKTDMLLYRRTDLASLAPGGDVRALQGTILRERGYTSSAAGRTKWSGDTHMIIRANKGTRAMWVDNISMHPGEQEVILDRDARFYVHAVRQQGGGWEMDVELVDEAWARAHGKVWDPAVRQFIS
jgi:hypothetical protein